MIKNLENLENLNLLKEMSNSLIQIDISIGGVSMTCYAEDVSIEDDGEDIILYSCIDENIPIHIKKEYIVEIDEEYTGRIILCMIYGTITISKI